MDYHITQKMTDWHTCQRRAMTQGEKDARDAKLDGETRTTDTRHVSDTVLERTPIAAKAKARTKLDSVAATARDRIKAAAGLEADPGLSEGGITIDGKGKARGSLFANTPRGRKRYTIREMADGTVIEKVSNV